MAIFNQWNINGSNPVTVGGTGTTAKYFQFPSGNFTSGVAPVAGPSAATTANALAVHGGNYLNGQQFSVVATGNFEVGPGGACPSVTIDMVATKPTTGTPTWTTLATTGAVTAQSNLNVFYPWQLEAVMNGDTLSGTLNGYQEAIVDNTVSYASRTALSNTLSGLNFSGSASVGTGPQAGQPVFVIAIRVTFSVSEPGNSANMYSFQIVGN